MAVVSRYAWKIIKLIWVSVVWGSLFASSVVLLLRDTEKRSITIAFVQGEF